jgi:hypothetical protein
MSEGTEALKQASEMFRASSFSIENKIRDITAQMNTINKEAAAQPEKKEEDKPEPFQGHSVALDTLFVIAFLLIRLLNQNGLSEITRGKLTNYFEHIKGIIDVYSYMLIIGHTIDYPPVPKKDEGEDKTLKNTAKKPAQTGGAEQKADETEIIEIKDNPRFLRELKAFYSYLFMAVSSNTPLKELLQYPSNPSFKEKTDWIGLLTPKEEAQLIKKESLATQDRLFQNVMDVFALLFDKFQIVAHMRSGKLTEQSALVDQLNQKVTLFNSVKSEKPGAAPAQNALAQTELLETIMKEGPIPIQPIRLKILGQELADTAGTMKQQLYAEATPDKATLKRLYGSISKLLGLKATETKATETTKAATEAATEAATTEAEAATEAETATTAATAATTAAATVAAIAPSPEKAAYESIKKLVSTTGGYRLRKSRKAQRTSKKQTLRRSKRL